MYRVYIRPLEEKDAAISVHWRNNPAVWKLTTDSPKGVTLEIETAWIKRVMERKNQARFAICLESNHQYIGNVQLTDITDKDAEFHVFIGEIDLWGKGIATEATQLILEYGFKELKLKTIYLWLNKENIAAHKAYLKNGFKDVAHENNMIKMLIKK